MRLLTVSAAALTAVAAALWGLTIAAVWAMPGLADARAGAVTASLGALLCWLHRSYREWERREREREEERRRHEEERAVLAAALEHAMRPAIQFARWTGPHARPRRDR